MEKTYHLVHIIFGKHGEHSYAIYTYRKSRRFTARQAWQYIHSEEHEVEAYGSLGAGATIEDYFDIVERHGLEARTCDRYVTFGFVNC